MALSVSQLFFIVMDREREMKPLQFIAFLHQMEAKSDLIVF